ncbi:MAG: manganese efflux pump MntP family protein [Oscillospiraceae bacterium]|nr:manganese efflux pump MntP family protein [Oscillospiraceae bacterium]
MEWNILFLLNSILFGIGLAMDAFSVSLANGMNEPRMAPRRMAKIAGVYAIFQIVMPLIGWFCVHTIAGLFASFQRFIPWIALLLLLYIGGKMLMESLQGKDEEAEEASTLSFAALLLQGLATSIDALSVGFTIANYSAAAAAAESLIIGIVTFLICIGGLLLGRRFGVKLAGKAGILGGIILIAIGIEIFLKGIL